VLNKLGYDAHRHPPPATLVDYGRTAVRGKIQIGMIGFTFAPRGDDVVSNLTCGARSNVGRFCDPTIDAEYKQGLSLEQSDPPAARALWQKVDRQLVDDAVWVPIWNRSASVLTSTRVGNWQATDSLGPAIGELWVR
jgi:peptide/nickel transport system substrate-binding protein/oligopeptide transport system substrate-binding protein